MIATKTQESILAWQGKARLVLFNRAEGFQSFKEDDVSKRQLKETLKRIRWLCSRCDLGYEQPPKRFGWKGVVLVRRLELSPKQFA